MQPDFTQFVKSEHKQLNNYHKQGMFGTPIPPEEHMTILRWVWTYLYKLDPVHFTDNPKSRGTCDGSSRNGYPVTLEETYASCLEHTAHRLVWALTAALNDQSTTGNNLKTTSSN